MAGATDDEKLSHPPFGSLPCPRAGVGEAEGLSPYERSFVPSQTRDTLAHGQ